MSTPFLLSFQTQNNFFMSLFPVSQAKMVSGGGPVFLQGQKPEEDSGIAFNNTNITHL